MNWIKILIISPSYKEITSCKTANNIHSTKIQTKRNNIQKQASKESNQWTGYIIMTISQIYRAITSWKTATNILATIIQMERNIIQIWAKKESINELDIW